MKSLFCPLESISYRGTRCLLFLRSSSPLVPLGWDRLLVTNPIGLGTASQPSGLEEDALVNLPLSSQSFGRHHLPLLRVIDKWVPLMADLAIMVPRCPVRRHLRRVPYSLLPVPGLPTHLQPGRSSAGTRARHLINQIFLTFKNNSFG